jgi:hypothetical protein
VSRERKKVERGLIVYREVKKFLGVFCPLISILLQLFSLLARVQGGGWLVREGTLLYLKVTERPSKGMRKRRCYGGYKRDALLLKQMICMGVGRGFVER